MMQAASQRLTFQFSAVLTAILHAYCLFQVALSACSLHPAQKHTMSAPLTLLFLHKSSSVCPAMQRAHLHFNSIAQKLPLPHQTLKMRTANTSSSPR